MRYSALRIYLMGFNSSFTAKLSHFLNHPKSVRFSLSSLFMHGPRTQTYWIWNSTNDNFTISCNSHTLYLHPHLQVEQAMVFATWQVPDSAILVILLFQVSGQKPVVLSDCKIAQNQFTPSCIPVPPKTYQF